eukprot:PITA_32279
MKQFLDIFAWEYIDIKTYDTNIIQNKILLEKNTIPFKQKLRPICPLLLPLIEKEIKKLLDAKIIVPLRYSKWIANLVVVRKKNGEIRLCVDFRNLSKCSKKDNYPLPKMEHLLQKFSGARVMSFLDGFSGYNQIVVHPEDQEKTSFTTPWGTFMYSKMPFGLMNVWATFLRAMDIALVGEKDKFVLIYLDDIIVFSSNHKDHLQHLKNVFLKCRHFVISVSPKNSQFSLEERKLLGHIVYAEGVKINPARVQAIQTLSIPRSKRDIQSFLGKIKFVRRFIPNFAKLVKHITSMLKKGSEIKWTDGARSSFEAIKQAIMEAPTLISPDYTREFYIFSFASYDTLATILLQKNDEGIEHPVAFFSKTLKEAKLRYDLIEKQAYALIKSLKAFRIYILHSKEVVYVPSALVKYVLTQPDIDGKRAKWIAKFIEFNIEKLEVPPGHSSSQARAIKLRSAKSRITNNLLYWKYPSGILLRCPDKGQPVEVMHQFHSSICGGHHYWKTTTHKIVRAGYYWPTLFSDVFSFVKSCDKCEISPHSSGHHKWIFVATDYFTKWIEVPTKNANHQVIIKFLNENIFTRFGCQTKLVTENAAAFRAEELVDMCESVGIQLVHSSSYYPQGNGLAESSNKNLVRIIKKLLEDNKKNWDSKLKFALWADRVTNKKSIGNSPFKLVYGTDVVLPIQLILSVAKFLQEE